MPLPTALRAYSADARAAFRLAPVEVLLGLTAAIALSVTLRTHDEETWLRIAGPAALAFPLVFALSLLHARGALAARARWGATAVVVAAAAAYGWLVLDPDRGSEGWRWASLVAASVLALTLVPAAWGARGRTDADRLRFWRFNALLVARAATVAVYGVLLYGALAGAVAAVDGLFELEASGDVFGDLAGLIFFVLVPAVLAGGIPALVAEREDGSEAAATAVVRLLGRFLYAPVLALYLAILLAYTGKVALTGEFPQNLLSPIVLLAGLAGFLGAVLLEPLRTDPQHTGVARTMRGFPAVLLALIPLAVWAVWMRRDEYGWTEFRYLRFVLLATLAGLAVAGTLRLLRGRPPLLRTVPLVLAALFFLSAVGPWSAQAVSRRNQQARLAGGLAAAGLLRDGRAAVAGWDEVPDSLRREVPEEAYDRVAGSLTYLVSEHGKDAVRGILPPFPDTLSSYSLLRALPIRPGCEPEGPFFAATRLAEGTAVPGVEGGTLVQVSAHRGARPGEPGAVRVELEAQGIAVHGVDAAGGWTARVPLREFVAELARAGGGCEPRRAERTLAPAEALRPLVDAAGRERGQLLLTTLRVGTEMEAGDRVGPVRVESAEGWVVLAPE